MLQSCSIHNCKPKQGAAEKRKLHLPEFQRLNLGLTIFAAATLGMNMLHWDLLRPSAALTAATIAGITASVPALFYSRTSGHGLRVRPIFEVHLSRLTCMLYYSVPSHIALLSGSGIHMCGSSSTGVSLSLHMSTNRRSMCSHSVQHPETLCFTHVLCHPACRPAP